MHNRSLARELSLISLGLIRDKGDFKLNKFQIEEIFESALDSLINHCRAVSYTHLTLPTKRIV